MFIKVRGWRSKINIKGLSSKVFLRMSQNFWEHSVHMSTWFLLVNCKVALAYGFNKLSLKQSFLHWQNCLKNIACSKTLIKSRRSSNFIHVIYFTISMNMEIQWNYGKSLPIINCVASGAAGFSRLIKLTKIQTELTRSRSKVYILLRSGWR